MLIETRMNKIVEIVDDKGSVSVQELMEMLNTSESTIRRDLASLHNNGQILKVHGGAVTVKNNMRTKDDEVFLRQELNRESKVKIARHAVSLIQPNDFIYLDAGTTTDIMADYMDEKSITVVTNGISHAKKLASKGIRTYLLGGLLKSSTEAIVGEEAVISLRKYNFVKGFFGTNGVTVKEGFTTPEVKEALLKEKAMERTKDIYILADSSKFGCISSVKFGDFNKGNIITSGNIAHNYSKYKNVLEV